MRARMDDQLLRGEPGHHADACGDRDVQYGDLDGWAAGVSGDGAESLSEGADCVDGAGGSGGDE